MLFLVICAVFALFPEKVLEGAGEGMTLCINTVIPSLLPFMLASSCLIKSNFARPIGCALSKVLTPVSGISPIGCVCFVIGLIGGYGAGAAAVRDCLKTGAITKKEAETLLAFCNNAGPLFVIGTVGSVFFRNVRIGIILYAINVLTALICGVIFCCRENPPAVKMKEEWLFYKKNKPPAGRLISECGATSAGAIVTVCVFVITFSAIINITGAEKIPFIAGIIEVTNGVRELSRAGSISLPLVSAVLAWGGLSVQLQASALCEGVLDMKKYYAGRILSCVISYIITYIVFGDFYLMLLALNIATAAFIIIGIIRKVSLRQRVSRQRRHS